MISYYSTLCVARSLISINSLSSPFGGQLAKTLSNTSIILIFLRPLLCPCNRVFIYLTVSDRTLVSPSRGWRATRLLFANYPFTRCTRVVLMSSFILFIGSYYHFSNFTSITKTAGGRRCHSAFLPVPNYASERDCWRMDRPSIITWSHPLVCSIAKTVPA